MKLFLSFIFIFFFALPAFSLSNPTVPVKGSSIADETLQLNVINKISKKLTKEYSTCNKYLIINTQIIQYPYNVKKKRNKYINGYWKELWNLNICGIQKQIPITFYIKRNGTKFYIENI